MWPDNFYQSGYKDSSYRNQVPGQFKAAQLIEAHRTPAKAHSRTELQLPSQECRLFIGGWIDFSCDWPTNAQFQTRASGLRNIIISGPRPARGPSNMGPSIISAPGAADVRLRGPDSNRAEVSKVRGLAPLAEAFQKACFGNNTACKLSVTAQRYCKHASRPKSQLRFANRLSGADDSAPASPRPRDPPSMQLHTMGQHRFHVDWLWPAIFCWR